MSFCTDTSLAGIEVPPDVANRLPLLVSLPAFSVPGQSNRSVISRLVSLPESVSVAKKCVGFSRFRQSTEDSNKRGITISWSAEQVGELSLKDRADSTGSKGRVSPV